MKTPLIPIALTAVACLCFAGCEKKQSTPKASDNSSGNPLTAPADYVGAVAKGKQSAEKTLGKVGIDQALKTFFAEEGRYPKSLDELKAKGVNVPDAPPGMKWDYDPNSGAVKAVPQ